MKLRQFFQHSRQEPVDKYQLLLTMDILRDLDPEAMRRFDAQTVMRTCRKGQILYSQEDQAEALFLLKRGQVRVYRLTASGKRLDLATVSPGTFFGEMPLLGESLRHAFAEVSDDAVVCVMSRADIERLIRDYPAVALRMLEVMGKRIALNETRLEEMAYRSVASRIAAVVLRLSQGHGGEIAMTHQELGDMIGALRETVTKTLDEFQRAGLLELRRGCIVVLDAKGLQERIDV